MMDRYRDDSLGPNPAPVVNIQNLHNNQLLAIPILLTGTASHYSDIESIRVIINGTTYSATGNSDWTNWSFDLSAAALANGQYQITVIARDTLGIEGTATCLFYYGDGPDLSAAVVDTANKIVNQQTLITTGSVEVEISNSSAYNINNSFQVLIFEDTNNNQTFESTQDIILGSRIVFSGLSSETSTTVSIPVSGSSLFFDNITYAFVDSENTITEFDESNNITHNMANIQYFPPVGSFNPVVEWQWTGSLDNPASDQVMCAPVVANLNDDNNDGQIDINDIPDIIFNSFITSDYRNNGTLRAISGDGSGELFSITGYNTAPGSNPAVGDIDNDGLPEIIVAEGDGSGVNHLLAFENDGTFKWRTPQGVNLPYAAPTLADIDQDGQPEIIIGNFVLNNDGSLKWAGLSGSAWGFSCVANLDLTGHPEIIVGNTAFNSDGSIYWQNASITGNFCAIGNFDNDAFPEVVVIGNGECTLLEHDGTIKWGPIDLTSTRGGPPTIADVDNDGEPEIGVATSNKFVVLETDGTIKWTADTNDISSGITGSSVFDFEGDGNAELVYADSDKLRIYRGIDGNVLYEYEIGNGTLFELPVIVDVDNDNKAEIIVTANNYWDSSKKNGIFIFGDDNDTWVNTRKVWNQHSYHVTNINDDLTIPQVEQNNWDIYNNYRQNQLEFPAGCFDLSTSYIIIETGNFPASVDIRARIGNSGALSISNTINVSFYLDDPLTGGTLLGTEQIINRLDPGEYRDLSFTWTTPNVGIYNIYVVADDDGAGRSRVREINESNNIWFSQIILP